MAIKINTLLISVLIFSSLNTFAQKSPKKFGDISIDDLKKEYSQIDSLAGAEVLLDYGFTTFDHNFEIILEYHIRLKIYNETEFDRADVNIPYGAKERVEKLKAATYNLEGGKIVTSEISKKDIFEEKVNDYRKQKKFSLPS